MGKFKRNKKGSQKPQHSTTEKTEKTERDKFYALELNKFLEPTPYWDLCEEKLFYNPETFHQVETLVNLLERRNFMKIEKRARLKRPNLPFIVLLHGPSGTGKTALVREICKQTKRHLLEVKAETLRNESYGQDEKATVGIFSDYIYAQSTLEEYPVLFFDECEAHLCKRMKADNFNPTMINHLNNITTIWLKEFQNLHGILFLATNRKDDIDDAFARRILFEIEVSHPDKEIQATIWQHYFPKALTPEQCKSLAEETNFTGGQIKQVQTKADIHELLYGKITFETIRDICETNGKTTTERKRIGFSL